ncbi:MucR family transcriptional regulator [uncultured Sphingomonas sp.]|uniref:MucR family transcriptional regulator n=1 Tax=uncultured Sphingomonas sp. TaxID=158754 RepID=UPI002624EF8E|nr:MucR family transcriptional regulator [uncultured Sphingomonas sp.]
MTDAIGPSITLTVDIVSAYLSNNEVAVSEVETVIGVVHRALKRLAQRAVTIETKQKPAVSIKASVKPDYLVCLEDGKKLTMLRRYLRTHFGMTPAQYRSKWNLPLDYPMVAPSYARKRSELAKARGLGRKPKAVAAETVQTVESKPAKAVTKAPAKAIKPVAAGRLRKKAASAQPV